MRVFAIASFALAAIASAAPTPFTAPQLAGRHEDGLTGPGILGMQSMPREPLGSSQETVERRTAQNDSDNGLTGPGILTNPRHEEGVDGLLNPGILDGLVEPENLGEEKA
ncbi:hypothetical protein FISHEDRAFT_58104 [Fistulina hepatica ATCC 64428]|uniref:Uncharacterized protein n=1 Tax=Fistulina hepatica ATCC 64428 TaxID=1128425 RepID=A0A0D7AHS8_9AGAR|nr:hypothetical protein FISHEDRAFT_58104 [Fistulina hepatica ATCC 64428]